MIKIRNLRKEYPNAVPLADVSVDIGKGEVVSIIGPSGTGKSTLIRCINRLDEPTSGDIYIDGENIMAKDCDVSRVRQKMGMVFQHFNLFPHMTVIENLMCGPVDLLGKSRQEAYDKSMELLRTVGLADKALSYPDQLSGGQKQRVAIARTLAMDPEIILFDEPTSALDPAMIGEVQKVIMDLKDKGLTMMVVTHEMKFARDIATRVFYMDQGGIYDDGTPEEIFDHPVKERTRQFIRKIKYLDIDINSKTYDFLGVNTMIEEFGIKHRIPHGKIYNVQAFFEEICAQIIIPSLSDEFDIRVTVEYPEEGEAMGIEIKYSGELFNPLDSDNEISLMIARKVAGEITHSAISEGTYTNLIKARMAE